MRLAITCTIIFFLTLAQAQQMRIGVFRDLSVKRISFSYSDGSYTVFGDTTEFGSILPNEFVELLISGSKVLLKKGTVELGEFSKVYLIQNNTNTSLSLAPREPAGKQRKYEDDFEIRSSGKDLTVVNLVDIDNYIAGVVESEGGGGGHPEYYKVQALMSRTYALKYRGKHKKEGFDLCDKIHCQAYFSMLRYSPEIDSAVISTHDEVMTDAKGQLIESYFHANCGGQTCEPQLIWNSKLDYLSTFIDTFCIYTKQASWEKRIRKDKWREFLETKFGYPAEDSVFESIMYTFDQPQRMAFYLHPMFGIPLRDLREEFNLKSTFFSCHPEGDEVVLQGRGFGHGVGLCQEGAMKMARSGYNYRQIALFYFPGIQIVNYSGEQFFRQKGGNF